MSEEEKESEEEVPSEEETEEKEEKPKEKKPKEKKTKEKMQGFEEGVKEAFGKWGYTSIWDYVVFFTGIYGFIWFLISMIRVLLTSPLPKVGFTLYWIITFLVLLVIMLFPFFAKLVKKAHEKWPKFMPLSFITDEGQLRDLVLYIGWWSTLLFWWIGTIFLDHAFWWYGLMFVVLTIVLLKDVFKKSE